MGADLPSPRMVPLPAPGLLAGDAEHIRDGLGRDPSPTEWRLFGALWSEHCAYRHSRPLLGTLFTDGPRVVTGPGENAGIVDLGNGMGIALKAESHNHPSAVEPYEGAATGVGGILRDILALGARPIAVLDGLCFGPQDDPRARYLRRGITDGVGGYGNAVGVPTTGGFVRVHPSYRENPLVNVFAIGTVALNRIVYGQARIPGDLVVLFGATTGRDGAGGASFASDVLGEAGGASRPMVQVGDPFAEKRLIEATLEILASDGIHACQDLGAAGLASATSEMAARGQTGMDLDLSRVPLRQDGLSPWEILISESQERMAITCDARELGRIVNVCDRHGLTCAAIGTVTDSGRYVVRMGSDVAVDVPLDLLVGAPPQTLPDAPEVPNPALLPAAAAPTVGETTLRRVLEAVLTDPNAAPRTAIYETYDHQVGARTALGPPHGATVLALETRPDAVAVTFDANPHLAAIHPRTAAFLTVLEAIQNLAAVGATPLGLTNCMNLGSPDTPRGAQELRETVRGLDAACRMTGVPIVSGNVSLYNETSRGSIVPTVSVGMVGHLAEFAGPPPPGFTEVGDRLLVVGPLTGTYVGSLFERVTIDSAGGEATPTDPGRADLPGWMPDLPTWHAVCELVRRAMYEGLVRYAADIWTGGLLATLVRHLAGEAAGAALSLPAVGQPEGSMALTLFGEGPGRFLVSAQPARVTALSTLARELGAPVIEIGTLTAEPALRVSTQGPGTGQGDSASADRPWTVDLAPLRRLSARVFGPALPDPYP